MKIILTLLDNGSHVYPIAELVGDEFWKVLKIITLMHVQGTLPIHNIYYNTSAAYVSVA